MTTVIAAVAMAGGLAVPLAAPAAADTTPPAGTPATVSADGLPTWQLNGVVWSQAVVGRTVYVTGSFTAARPPGAAAGGSSEVPALNVFAYDIVTGNRVPSFDHALNGQGRVVRASPDGSRVYVGGEFSTVDGVATGRLVAFDTATNQRVTSFQPQVTGKVSALAVSSDTVWLGGNFFNVNGQARNRLAAVRVSNGANLPWAPAVGDNEVAAMVLAPDGSRVIVGGKFTTINGESAKGMGSLDAVTGQNLPWAANQKITAGTDKSGITSLSTDGTSIFGSAFDFGGGNFEGTFAADPSTGALRFANDCHGDTYDTFAQSGVLYSVSHAHDCRPVGGFPEISPRRWMHALAWSTTPSNRNNTGPDSYGWDYSDTKTSDLLHWYPNLGIGSYTKQYQAAWSVAGNADYVVMGGEFPTVDGRAQQGLTRMAVSSKATLKRGPVRADTTEPVATSPIAGRATVTFPAAYDQDNQTLTYQLIRAGETKPIATTTAASNFWKIPTVRLSANGLTPGSTQTYTVRAVDPHGNAVALGTSNAVTISDGTSSAYADRVVADGASAYWKLNETGAATPVYDYAGVNDALVAGKTITRGASGAITGSTDTAISSNGSSGFVVSPTMARTPDYTVEAWVRTGSTTGGLIVGYGDGATTAGSTTSDRQVYLDNDGRLNFLGLRSRKAVNDNTFHHVVATRSATGGAVLYLDGKQVAADPVVRAENDYVGNWRIGSDSLVDVPNQPTSTVLGGSFDDVAIYPRALSASQIQQHYVDSGRTVAADAPAPADAYGTAIVADGPLFYWRLGDTGSAADSANNQMPGTYAGGTTPSATAMPAGVDGSTQFNGTNGTVGSAVSFVGPKVYSTELWFNTTTKRGGKLVGFGSTRSGNSNSASVDRHVYMDTNGQLTFGTYPNGSRVTISSPRAYNDGAWHQVVATQGSDGMKLYVDGSLVASNTQTGSSSSVGFWRVGGDTSWAGDNYFNGRIDEVAVYDQVLGSDAVASHFQIGSGPANVAPTAAFTSTTSGRTVSFTGQSADADGAVVSQVWNFGDGTATDTGAAPRHTYAAPGSYQVTLTATDDKGARTSVTRSVTVTNAAPVAAFTDTRDQLRASFDASGSSDPDGTVAGYSWSWGDGTPDGTGVRPAHTYAAAGTYAVRLTVRDNDGATTVLTRSVTVAANQAPVARFASTATKLAVSVNGTESSDADGTIASYSWSWGDGTPNGSGATATHTYATSGTYPVTLTVTDDRGTTGTVTRSLSVITQAATLATDAFNRSTTNQWGTADLGGTWALRGAAANFSVAGGVGTLRMPSPTAGPSTFLNGVSSTRTSTSATLTNRVAPTGGGTFAYIAGRELPGGGGYRLAVNYRADRTVTLGILRRSPAGADTFLVPYTAVSGLKVDPGDQVNIRFLVDGSGTTTLRARAWVAGTPEPTTWMLNTSDATPELQGAGTVGVASFLSGTATNAPAYLDVRNFSAVEPN